MSGMEKWKHLKIPFSDITEATRNFHKNIGTGGYGSVYEGKLLRNESYMKVAVKRLNEIGGQGLKEFLNEIDLLSGQRHENIISLVGYCDEGNEKIIVYEFADRGSLDIYFRIKNSNYNITWLERLKIVVDAARGLDHLHNHLKNNQVIIHRDVKSSNVLLDNNLVAKISDFGLSKSTYSGTGRSTAISHACGTFGYVEPELIKTLIATRKTDVYSFGIVLFEVLSGRLCNSKYEDGIILTAALAIECYASGDLEKIIDPVLREQMNPNSLRTFLAVAIDCLKAREQRPLMDVVKKELEASLKIQVTHLTPINSMSRTNLLRIPLAEIKDATKGFRNPIIEGDYGYMYEGELSIYGIYTKVMIKRSYMEFGQGFYEFLTEIQMLSGKQHENLTTLVGYCDEGKERIIVYEYAKHGSLDQYIRCRDTNYTLTWLERLKIVVDVARGLDHVHNHLGKHQVVIDWDVNSSTILLDDKWVAKISNIGVSSLTLHYTKPTMAIMDAHGNFWDPRYWEAMVKTKNSDIYSFGVVLFEVLCGRLCNVKYDDGILLSAKIAKEYYAKGNMDKLIDPILRKQMTPDSLRKFLAIGYECLQGLEQQPPMDVVKLKLEETLKVEVLHWRWFFSRHWYILDVGGLSPETHILMQNEEAERLESLSISCEEDTTDKGYGTERLEGLSIPYEEDTTDKEYWTKRFEGLSILYEEDTTDKGYGTERLNGLFIPYEEDTTDKEYWTKRLEGLSIPCEEDTTDKGYGTERLEGLSIPCEEDTIDNEYGNEEFQSRFQKVPLRAFPRQMKLPFED